jgi:hypothetical protein
MTGTISSSSPGRFRTYADELIGAPPDLAEQRQSEQSAPVESDVPNASSGSESKAWKPAGWDDWSQERRTLWRREHQLQRGIELVPNSDEEAESRARIIEHLRTEIDELRRRIQ